MPVRKKRVSTETILALAATVTSVCALIVAVYQTKLSREQQLNSVWPYLITYRYMDESQRSNLMVANYGIGPAIIDSVRVVYENKAYSLPTQVISTLSKKLDRGEFGIGWSHTELRRGLVIPQGQVLTWVMVNDSSDNVLFSKELPKIKSYIYYHSIYGERWHSVFNDSGEMVVTD
ncbi:hypothetical protein GCM10027299_32810 [Larkinella ripae]